MRLHASFSFTGIIRLALGIKPMVLPPRTPSSTNLSFVDSPDPLTGHSILLHTLCSFVDKRGLTIARASRYFRPASTMRCLSALVTLCASVRFTCFYLHKVLEGLPSYILWTFIRSDRWPWRIWCYKMGSNDSSLWWGDATTQPSCDDAPSQYRGRRGVLLWFFEVRLRKVG